MNKVILVAALISALWWNLTGIELSYNSNELNEMISMLSSLTDFEGFSIQMETISDSRFDTKGRDNRTIVIAQNRADDVNYDEINLRVQEALQKAEEATKGLDSRVVINIDARKGDSPYMGIVTADLTLRQASDLGYNKFYGVLVTRVVPGSPASAHRLLPNDIIMEIDNNRISDKQILNNVIDFYNIGDSVRMKLFRNRQETEINFTFGSRTGTVDSEGRPVAVTVTSSKPKLSAGTAGGSWIPVWFTPDMTDVNALIAEFGFSEIDDRGQFLNGGGGKINVGKGLFLGGMGAGYTLERKTNTETGNIRRMRYSVGYGGVTVDQRVPLSRKFIVSIGSMLGWGGTSIQVSQNDGNYDWKKLSDQLNDSQNNYLDISKNYIFLQPKTELYYRLNDWLSIRAEVGYILSYSYHSGWNLDDSGEVYEIKNSPDTSFDGLTISIGPWFGF